ncbi:HBL/NHE enterotoxin family protein [Bacillus thuringiensis]|uniref:HBL/NHE enterotoxin family protein n=1 Tax=Bacillus thuringiensis TaxID=1428 RepID=UPI003459DFDC
MNRKKYYKAIALSTILTITTTALTPIKTFAEEQISIKDKLQNENLNLGTGNLKETILETQKQVTRLDIYALELRQQPDFEFKYLQKDGYDKDPEVVTLQGKLAQDLINSKNHAATWLNKLKPQLIQTNENVIKYSTRFSKFHSPLYRAAETKDKEVLKKGLILLSKDVAEQKIQVTDLAERLQEFRANLETDSSAFNTDTNKINVLLTAKGGINETNLKMLQTYNETIDTNNKIIIGSSFALIVSVGLFIAGAVMFILPEPSSKVGAMVAIVGAAGAAASSWAIASASKNNDNLRDKVGNLTAQMKGNELLITDLTNSSKRTQNLSNVLDTAIKNLQSTIDQWISLENKYNNLIDQIDQTDTEDLTFVTVDLDTEKEEWNSIAKMAQGFYQ